MAYTLKTIHIYCYENGNGVLKMVNKSSKNKNNGLVYMINKKTKKYSKNLQQKYSKHAPTTLQGQRKQNTEITIT